MLLKFTNNARAQLAAPISAVATSIQLAAGAGALFPAIVGGEYFYATLQDAPGNLEIVKVTARAGDVLTVVRAQDNTTAKAFSALDTFGSRTNAAMLLDLATGAATDVAAAYVPLAQKGVLNGVATLDSGGTVPDAQISPSITRDSEVTAALAAYATTGDAIAYAIALG